TASLLRLHAGRQQIAGRQRHLALRFTAAHPGVPATTVPALAEDVHDLDGLREIGAYLAEPR
ncbi:MAG: ArsA family ATPase, partial [Actinomycetales bacterium]